MALTALDRWWETILDESTDEEGVSFDTNSISQQSSSSAKKYPRWNNTNSNGLDGSSRSKKQIRWLLPRSTDSFEDSLDEENSNVMFFSVTDTKNRNQDVTHKTSKKNKWSLRKKEPKKDRSKKQNSSEKNAETDFWGLFNTGVKVEREGEVRGTVQGHRGGVASQEDKGYDFWPSEFGFFDERDDNPSRAGDRTDRRNKHRRRIYDDPSEEEILTDSSSYGGQLESWDNSGLLGTTSDGTFSTNNSTTSENTDHDMGRTDDREPSTGTREETSFRDSTLANENSVQQTEVFSGLPKAQIASDSFNSLVRHSTDDEVVDRDPSKNTTASIETGASANQTHPSKQRRFRWRQRPKSSKAKNTDDTGSQPSNSSEAKVQKKKSSIFSRAVCKGEIFAGYDKHINEMGATEPEPISGSIRSLSTSEGRYGGYSDRYVTERMKAEKERSDPRESSDDQLATIMENSNLMANERVPRQMYSSDNNNHMGLVFEGFGGKLHIQTYSGPPDPRPGEILVKVEASTVSHSDCMIHRGGWWKDGTVPLPNTPGVDLVGVVHEISPRDGAKWHLKPGDRVMAFVKWGGNARFAVVDAEHAVSVPKHINPAEAVCLPDTYLSAFQTLHIGQSSNVRYGRHALRGKSILVLGAFSSMGKAVVELAFAAGTTRVYATAKHKHHDGLQSLGVRPLDRNSESWLAHYHGKMDLVLVADCEQFNPRLLKALTPEGSLVFIGKNVSSTHYMWLHEEKPGLLACAKYKSQLRKRIHAYDVFESWERNTTRCKHDVRHLLMLLSAKTVKPHIVDRVPLEKVEKAQELLKGSKRIPGAFVCEPWTTPKRRALYM